MQDDDHHASIHDCDKDEIQQEQDHQSPRALESAQKRKERKKAKRQAMKRHAKEKKAQNDGGKDMIGTTQALGTGGDEVTSESVGAMRGEFLDATSDSPCENGAEPNTGTDEVRLMHPSRRRSIDHACLMSGRLPCLFPQGIDLEVAELHEAHEDTKKGTQGVNIVTRGEGGNSTSSCPNALENNRREEHHTAGSFVSIISRSGLNTRSPKP